MHNYGSGKEATKQHKVSDVNSLAVKNKIVQSDALLIRNTYTPSHPLDANYVD